MIGTAPEAWNASEPQVEKNLCVSPLLERATDDQQVKSVKYLRLRKYSVVSSTNETESGIKYSASGKR